MKISCAALVATLLVAGTAPGQNLLTNPGFDNVDQLAGWTCTMGDGTVTWSTTDHMASPSSGSMQIDMWAAANNSFLQCSQCVPVAELYGYLLSAWHLWPDVAGLSQLGTTRIVTSYFSDANCSTFIANGDVGIGHPILDSWRRVQADEDTAPAGAASARINLVAWQNNAGEMIRTHIDDVDFRTTTIFRDGFESGGIAAWIP